MSHFWIAERGLNKKKREFWQPTQLGKCAPSDKATSIVNYNTECKTNSENTSVSKDKDSIVPLRDQGKTLMKPVSKEVEAVAALPDSTAKRMLSVLRYQSKCVRNNSNSPVRKQSNDGKKSVEPSTDSSSQTKCEEL